jgi:hypothetical protein
MANSKVLWREDCRHEPFAASAVGPVLGRIDSGLGGGSSRVVAGWSQYGSTALNSLDPDRGDRLCDCPDGILT